MQARANRKRISSINNDDGKMLGNEEMNQHFVSAFQKQLGSDVDCDSIWGLEEWFTKNLKIASRYDKRSRG